MPGHVLLAMALAGLVGAAPAAPPPSLLVTDIALVDVETGTVTPPRDLWIEGARIAAIAPRGMLDRGRATTVVDGAGKYALPGLIDVHAHLGDGGAREQTDADREQALGQFLRYGVTSIFVPGGGGANDAQLARWRRRCANGEIACPGIKGSGAIITAAGGHPLSTIFDLPADVDPAVAYARGATALQPGGAIDGLVAARVAKGADAIKIVIEDGPPPWYPKPRLSDEQIAALSAAAQASGVPIYAHVSRSAHVEAALAGRIDAIMHAPLDRMPDPLLERMAQAGTFFVATLSLYDGIKTWTAGHDEDDAYALAGVSGAALESLMHPGFLASAPENAADAEGYADAAGDNLVRAVRAHVPIALGTDTSNPFVYPGYSAHEELSLMVAAGLSPAQALHAATIGGARFLGWEGRVGRLAPGYEADLLILDANPLADIVNTRRIDRVISDGREVSGSVSTSPRGR